MNKSKKWREHIALAQNVLPRRNKNQMFIAGLALDVCDISWGGARYKDEPQNKYTLTRFAKEVGISPKILSSWVNVRRSVYDKLEPKKVQGVSFTKLAWIALRIPKKASPEEVSRMFEMVVRRDDISVRIQRYLSDLRALNFNFEHKNAARFANKKTLEEIVFYIRETLKHIEAEHPKIQGIDHRLAAVTNIKSLSAAVALDVNRNEVGNYIEVDGYRAKISPKDRDVIAHLKKFSDRWHSPTEVGMKIGKQNANAASAWTGRTFSKLVALKIVERNKRGHYRIVQ